MRWVSFRLAVLLGCIVSFSLSTGSAGAQQGVESGASSNVAAASAAPSASPWNRPQDDYIAPFDLPWNDGRWWVSGYFGALATDDLSEIVTGSLHFTNTYLFGLTLGREFASIWNGALRLEWEIGAALHFGDDQYVDGQALIVARWTEFPWNEWLPTTFAVGTGPSLASQPPKSEERSKSEARRYMNGYMMELTFGLPQEPDWQMMARLHHRSKIFGLLPGGEPSDYVGLGVKKRF